MTDHIALYGKGGVGTSTVAANVSAALAEAGFSILLVGCGPGGDSCGTLLGGNAIPTVSELLRTRGEGDLVVSDIVRRGFKGIACLELGNPLILEGCTVTGMERVFRLIDNLKVFDRVAPDFVLYDNAGDGVCARLHQQLMLREVQRVFVVTSADYLSLRTANDLCAMLSHTNSGAGVLGRLGGLIPNGITSAFEESFILDFAAQIQAHVLGRVPRSLVVRQCELYGKTVIEASPLSNQAYFYRRLANQIVDEVRMLSSKNPSRPLAPEQLREWAREWGDRLYALDNGLVMDGAAI